MGVCDFKHLTQDFFKYEKIDKMPRDDDGGIPFPT